MNADVCRGGDTSLRQRLKDDWGVHPGEPGAAIVGVGHHGTEAQARRVTESVHGKDALKKENSFKYVFI